MSRVENRIAHALPWSASADIAESIDAFIDELAPAYARPSRALRYRGAGQARRSRPQRVLVIAPAGLGSRSCNISQRRGWGISASPMTIAVASLQSPCARYPRHPEYCRAKVDSAADCHRPTESMLMVPSAPLAHQRRMNAARSDRGITNIVSGMAGSIISKTRYAVLGCPAFTTPQRMVTARSGSSMAR